MKARYSKVSEGKSGKLRCNVCKKFDWFIIIERGGAKEDFQICSNCGNKLTEMD